MADLPTYIFNELLFPYLEHPPGPLHMPHGSFVTQGFWGLENDRVSVPVCLEDVELDSVPQALLKLHLSCDAQGLTEATSDDTIQVLVTLQI